jgi:hypothetical protein
MAGWTAENAGGTDAEKEDPVELGITLNIGALHDGA